MTIKAKEIFETSDGAQHDSMEAAESHQFALDNAERIEVVAESYVNVATAPGAKVAGMVGRTRAFNLNVAKGVVAFVLSQGGSLPEDFEAITPSKELQARLDEEAAKVAAKQSEKKTEDKAEDTDTEADSEDLFE